jgi:hypothetical protein
MRISSSLVLVIHFLLDCLTRNLVDQTDGGSTSRCARRTSRPKVASLTFPDRLAQVDFQADAGWYMQAGAPAILIGPDNFEVAHAYDEWVDIEEIIDATKIYALAAMSWCGYSLR